MPRLILITVALACLASCHSETDASPPDIEKPLPAYRPVASVKQTMTGILDPAADVIWDSSGFIITAEGERDLSPSTAEGWERVRDNAAIVAEAGNLLMMPGRAAGPDWIAHAEALIVAAEHAMNAAETRDADGLFDAGGEIYRACRGCHAQFMVLPEKSGSAR